MKSDPHTKQALKAALAAFRDVIDEAHSRRVIAGLKGEMQGSHSDWRRLSASRCKSIRATVEYAFSEKEKRMAAVLSNGCFRVGQFFCELEVLARTLRRQSSVLDKDVERAEELVANLCNGRRLCCKGSGAARDGDARRAQQEKFFVAAIGDSGFWKTCSERDLQTTK